MIRFVSACVVLSQAVLVHAQANPQQRVFSDVDHLQKADGVDEELWSRIMGYHEVTDVTFHGVHKPISLLMEWRISQNGSSYYRYEKVDGGELTGAQWGRATVDATKKPMWLTFRYHGISSNREAVLRCIFKVEGDWITIAIPGSAKHGHYNSQRPTSFDSTEENEYVVMKMATAETQKEAFAIKADRARARVRSDKRSR